MTTLTKPRLDDIWHPWDHEPIVGASPCLATHFEALPASSWLWCFQCERAFQAGSLRHRGAALACGYADCEGQALDIWQWDAYAAFVGNVAKPLAGARFSLTCPVNEAA